jgi:hypothetical protein
MEPPSSGAGCAVKSNKPFWKYLFMNLKARSLQQYKCLEQRNQDKFQGGTAHFFQSVP